MRCYLTAKLAAKTENAPILKSSLVRVRPQGGGMIEESRARLAILIAIFSSGTTALLVPSPAGDWSLDYREFLSRNNDADQHSGTRPLGLHWQAPFLSGGGYCSEATSFMFGLIDASSGMRLSIEQHGDSYNAPYVGGLPHQDQVRLGHLLQGTAGGRRGWSNTVEVCHSEPGAWHVSAALPQRYSTSVCPHPDSAVRIGRTMFESDRTPSGWVDRLSSMDELWVPSVFQRDVFAAGGVDPAKMLVLPEAVDTAYFDRSRYGPVGGPLASDQPDARELRSFGLPPRSCAPGEAPGASPACPYRFLSVGKFERRKGFDVLLRAYLREFANWTTAQADHGATDGRLASLSQGGESGPHSAPHVELFILTSAYHSTSDFEGAVAKMVTEQLECSATGEADTGTGSEQDCVPRLSHARRPPVRLLHDVPQALLPAVYASADCFVLASRGEGWGRPHVEAMATGLPVIATHWSGPSEFMTHDNSYPLRHTGLEPIPDGPFAGHLQAAPDVSHLRKLLRRVVQHQDEAAAKGAQARVDMVRLYSPQALARFLIHQVQRISAAVNEKRTRKSLEGSRPSVSDHAGDEL